MTKKFKLTRDTTSQISYGLSISDYRKLDALFASGEEYTIPLGGDEQYAFVFPTVGTDFMVSYKSNVVPTTPGGTVFNGTDSVINIGHFDLYGWLEDPVTQSRRLYIRALNAGSISVIIGAGNRSGGS